MRRDDASARGAGACLLVAMRARKRAGGPQAAGGGGRAAARGTSQHAPQHLPARNARAHAPKSLRRPVAMVLECLRKSDREGGALKSKVLPLTPPLGRAFPRSWRIWRTHAVCSSHSVGSLIRPHSSSLGQAQVVDLVHVAAAVVEAHKRVSAVHHRHAPRRASPLARNHANPVVALRGVLRQQTRSQD